jgi:hypothetical protein
MSYEVEYNPDNRHRCHLPPLDKYPVGTRIRCTSQEGLTKKNWVPPCGKRWELKKRWGSLRWHEWSLDW